MGLVVKNDGWRVPERLWAEIEPLLPERPTHPLGCHNPRVPGRDAMNEILFVLRTGCQWNALNATGICPRFQELEQAGVFAELWRRGLLAYDKTTENEWERLAMDGALTKATARRRPYRAESH